LPPETMGEKNMATTSTYIKGVTCQQCRAELLNGAKFCHKCGEKTVEPQKSCPKCLEQNPTAAVFCHHCGHNYEGSKKSKPKTAFAPDYLLDFEREDNLKEQLRNWFFKDLRTRVQEEGVPTRHSDYVERTYSTRFREVLEYRLEQMARGVLMQWEEGGETVLPKIDGRLNRAFEGLLDYFFIHFCRDLGVIKLPEAMLKYENARLGKIDIGTMVADFLEFSNEVETVFTDFITMPVQKLQNTCTAYLHADRREKLFFICDLSLSGNCKEGFAMSDKGIYWKPQFSSAHQVHFGGLKELKYTREYLTINSHFFNANPSLNLKLYKLLKKLREMNA
jgi:ribosomal protein L40E